MNTQDEKMMFYMPLRQDNPTPPKIDYIPKNKAMNTQDKDALEFAIEKHFKNNDFHPYVPYEEDVVKRIAEQAFRDGAKWQSSANQPSTIESDVDEVELWNTVAATITGSQAFSLYPDFLNSLIQKYLISLKAANKELSFTLKDVELAFEAGEDMQNWFLSGRGEEPRYNSREEYIAQLLKEK